jgi:hypothetical protein
MLLMAACSSESRLGSESAESRQGTVYLKQISDPSFQAAHPIKIETAVIGKVLSGILIRNNEPAAASTSSPSRAFAGSDIGYLAPLISENLRRATSDQQVGFRMGDVAGVVYAYGRSLYVTLTQYPSGSDTATATTTDGTGMGEWTVAFIPEAAKRPDSYLDPRSRQATLVIDYELLAILPSASLASASATSRSGSEKPEPSRDAEIEALRKELQEIKKQLAEQEADRARSQPKNIPPQK